MDKAIALAVLVAGALIAAAILVTNHYEMVVMRTFTGLEVIQRLDRWSGAITVCSTPIQRPDLKDSLLPGYVVPCYLPDVDTLHPAPN